MSFVLRMAWRELRAAPRRLVLLALAVASGVAALVAINGFAENVRTSVREQARALLGADLALSSRRPFPRGAEAVLDSIAAGGAMSRVTSFGGMAYVPRTLGTRLVQVAAVEGRFPFYGQIRTDPSTAYRDLALSADAVVDPTLLTALGAEVGDTMALGEARFRITGTIISAPGNAGFRAALGPRVFIPARYLSATGLLGFGARAEYEAFVRLPANRSAQTLAAAYRPRLAPERVRVRTVAEDQRNLNDALTRLTGYLGLTALVALLLGGVGTASAVVVLVRRRIDTIAVLRCLGGSAGQVFAIYLIEAAALGLAGSFIGALAGLAIQAAVPAALAGLLPVEIGFHVSWRALATGIGMGLWTAIVFALLPLLAIRRVTPLVALRRDVEQEGSRADARDNRWWRDPWRWAAALTLVASTVALAALQVRSLRQGVVFAGGIGAALLVLWLASQGLVWAARRWLPARWPYVWRQGLANLHRPANQTVTVVLAIGFGAFLLATIFLVQYNLLRQLQITGGARRSNLVLFDIQPDQLGAVERVIRDARLPENGAVPIVPMRISSVNGRTVTRVLSDTASAEERDEPGRQNAWVVRREYRSTYRDTLVASERVVAGRWWSAVRDRSAPAQVSLEQEIARDLGVRVGDEIVWDVQGVALPSRVASLREVEWARFEPNFFAVFAPGALDEAPRTYVTLTRVDRPAARGIFQRQLAERFGNVSVLDLTVLQETLERLIGRVTLAIRFLALFTLAAGVLVLTGALATSRFQRVREGALLRTLGATRSQVLRVVLTEYTALGTIAAVVALGLASLAGWALARYFFEGTFALPVLGLLSVGAAVIALTVAVGLANSRDVVRRAPLEVLRAD